MSERVLHIPAKPFYLVRHGESHGNRFGYPAGSMDTRLTRLGRRQADATAAIIAGLEDKPDILIASTLVRARHTAEAIAGRINTKILIDRHLAEQFYGRHQGVAKARVHADHGKEWWRAPVGGETFDRFAARVVGRMAYWLNRHDGLPMFVGHSGIFAAFGEVYGNNLHNIPNAGAFLFKPSVDHGKIIWRLFHFGDDGLTLYAEL